MAIMSLKQFKRDTDKWFSLRNGAIGLIDNKLKAYHASPVDARLRELAAAIDAFMNEKDQKFAPKGGDHTNSKREKNGAVTELKRQVAAELATSNPARPIGVQAIGNVGLVAEVRMRALARQARADADTTQINVPVSQQLDYRDGTGLHDFAWNVQLKMTERPTELLVSVAVKLDEQGVITGDYRARWSRQIQSAWNCGRLILPAGHSKPIRFELDWYPIDYAGQAYTVGVHQPPRPPAEGGYRRTGTGRWEAQTRGPTVGSNVGTPHMGAWGADDEAAIAHEFGHMIGCPDEYYTKTYNGAAMSAKYDQVPFTTNSIMNNTGPDGRIHKRHFNLVLRQYEIWKGLGNGAVSVLINS